MYASRTCPRVPKKPTVAAGLSYLLLKAVWSQASSSALTVSHYTTSFKISNIC
jgi:hypothetical protein